jgi:catechol 2,3-dioxygenase-like lactoylglutathione lyase family enzyme
MKVTRVLHTSVNVSGTLDPTRAWYRDVLGLEPTWRPEIHGVPGAWFTVDEAQLHLVGSPERGDGSIDPGTHHVCFGVDDLDAAIAELEQAGIPYRRSAQDHNGVAVAQIFVADPAGNVVELQQDDR